LPPGDAQATCFSTDTFGCSGTPGGIQANGQACCDMGFLAFRQSGSDVCVPCPGKQY